MKRSPGGFGLAVAGLVFLGGALNCEAPPKDDPIKIGLMLSYTGFLSSNSINSERALLMAIENANAAGGIDGRRIKVLARDSRSDPNKAAAPLQELIDAGSAVLIGPDYTDLVTQVRPLIEARTVILPSFATASDVEWKPPSWFVMGAGMRRVACELVTQLERDGHDRRRSVQLVGTSGYNASLGFALNNSFELFKNVLASTQSASVESVQSLANLLATREAYVLAAPPEIASSLIYALAAGSDALDDPRRWYLSPTLHTPAFLDSIPKGILNGAKGVAPGTVAGAGDFRARFLARWQDAPLDDAYPFYDAGAIAVLAIQRATRGGNAIPTGTGLSQHIAAITRAGGLSVKWNELGKGLQLLREGYEIEFFGLTGQLQFDAAGQTLTASTKWWTIADANFVDLPHTNTCQ